MCRQHDKTTTILPKYFSSAPGTQYATANRKIELSMSVAEMRMFRRISGITREDGSRNEYDVRGSSDIVSIENEMRENLFHVSPCLIILSYSCTNNKIKF